MADPLPRTLAVLHDGIAQGLNLGAQLYVSLDGQTVADVAVGEARPGEAMTPDHLTLWMSAGKPVTAALAVGCVAEGTLSLDGPVADAMPEFGVNGKDAITLRHLLTHTGGFRGPMNNFSPGTWDELVARACALRQEPGWVPGERAGYHVGSSWFVLGRLVELATGRSLGEQVTLMYLHDEHALPDAALPRIGMSPEELERLRPLIAPMHSTDPAARGEFAGNRDDAITVPRPGANARGPIRMLGRFYERLHAATRGDSGGGLDPDLARQAVARQRVGMHDRTFDAPLDWGWGVMLDSKRYGGEHAYGFGPYASDATFGHGGNQSSNGFCDPERRLVVAWTCNGMPGEPTHQARNRAINAAVYEDLRLA